MSKKKLTVFGFTTKDFTTLNEDFKKCNGGELPKHSEIKDIIIFSDGDTLVVNVELYNI
jgi:hypothetical protein